MKHYIVKTAKGLELYAGSDLDQARQVMYDHNDKVYARDKLATEEELFKLASDVASLEYTDLAIKSANSDQRGFNWTSLTVTFKNDPMEFHTEIGGYKSVNSVAKAAMLLINMYGNDWTISEDSIF